MNANIIDIKPEESTEDTDETNVASGVPENETEVWSDYTI